MGWLVFAVAATVYCLTIEPTASFWDCPEFILSAYKLEVGHPPGAPFFMLAANVFSQLASDSTQVARMINLMNALLSASCIMFLYWSITLLVRRIYKSVFVIVLSGCVGALIYTFSDTFWFSAVEGEVYAFSSAFTAVVFWLMLKWENHADEPHSDRYIVLIAYMIGLSIGVHLLNLLCLPAIVLIWYYHHEPKATLWGSMKALLMSFLLLATILYGIIPGFVKVAGWFELLFVNVFGCPFQTGVCVYIVLLFVLLSWGIYETIRRGKRLYNTLLLCLLMIVIGYSSYAVILIRSTAHPPMDQNSPEDVFTLSSYLAREQYGHPPLMYGQAYTSQPEYEVDGNVYRPKMKHGEKIYKKKTKEKPTDRDEYIVTGTQDKYVYAQNMFFPRMWDATKADAYENWLGEVKGKMVEYQVGGESMMIKVPTQWENLRFFLSYQCNFMYWRYFMWNFCGRQNDLQGQGEVEHGNWITGIPWIDNARLGDQSILPDELRINKGHNVFYGLPLLLGFLGLLWQGLGRGRRGIQQFWVVFFLFFMTGLAIVVYLNQNPMQVRERDYSFAGSFYAFAIWCGIGVAAIHAILSKWLGKMMKSQKTILFISRALTLLTILIPIQMASQTWDDHDRSHRFACRDFGYDYLMSCQDEGNPILFCDGDNDTFPLWYNQEVENARTDVRVCNLNYLPTDWYVDQMRRPKEHAPALPIPWKRKDYIGSKREYVPVRPEVRQQVLDFYRDHPEEARKQFGEEPFELGNVLRHWVCADDENLQVIPTDTLYINIDKEEVRKSGMMLPSDTIPDRMYISLKGYRGLHRGQLAMLEVLANTHWDRPVYVCSSVPSSAYLGLDEYLVTEGIAERFTPFKHHPDSFSIDTERTYHNVMKRFRYGGLRTPNLYLDQTTLTMCWRMRMTFGQLALTLIAEGKYDKAKAVLLKEEYELPAYNIPLTYQSGAHYLVRAWTLLGEKEKAENYANAVRHYCEQYINWYKSMSPERFKSYEHAYNTQLAVLYYIEGKR